MNPEIKITKLDPNDKVSINLIADWYFSEWNTPLEKTRKRLSSQPNENTVFQAILTLDGELISTGGLCNHVNIYTTHPELEQYKPWIALLYVKTGHQKKGLGQKLLDFIETCAKEIKIKKIYLYTFTAQSFYKRNGWIAIKSVNYKNRKTVVMVKRIDVELRDTHLTDLETLFLFQLNEEANYLAAFTSKNPSDKTAYIKKWTAILSDKEKNTKTILLENEIVGSIAKFELEGKAEITYWIGKEYWGKGIATSALEKFLEIEQTRPLLGRVAADNLGSKRVLEKCGFAKIGDDKGFANARGKEIDELIFELK